MKRENASNEPWIPSVRDCRQLLDAAPDAIVVVNADDGRIVLVNAVAEELFGYARSELLGERIDVLIPERFRAAHAGHVVRSLRSPAVRPMGAANELYGQRRDQSEFPIEVRLAPVQTDAGLLVSSAIRDITERKKVEEQRTQLAAIVDASEDAIIGKTLGGVITSWNAGAQHTFGYAAEEVVGASINLLVPPSRESEEESILSALSQGAVRRFDTVRRRKDGAEIDVSVTISPVRDGAGRVVSIGKIARDITARKQAELALARARDTAEAASRELEAFSYSVAHDLRAPLRAMNGFAECLLDTYGERFGPEAKDWLEAIVRNAQKMADLIDALLSLSRIARSPANRESVDLSALVRAAAARLRKADPARDAELVVQDDLLADLQPALASALVENLIGNAWKFTRKTARARIEFGRATVGGEPAYFVRDNGVGFDMAFADKLFGPFQRLHAVDEFPGTGIGLATVQRIVHRHGGRTWAEGAVNLGATFYFTVPAHALPEGAGTS